jgi:hypothetical protein
VALRTDHRRGPRLRTRAAALAAGGRHFDGNLRLEAAERVLEREVDRDLDVRSALGLPPCAPGLPAVEDPAEQVAEIAEIVDGEITAAEVEIARIGPGCPSPVRRSERVVLLALLRIGERVVRVLDFLELLFRRVVAGILVRVELRRELAVGLLDLGRGGAFLHPERVVQSRQLALRRSGNDDPSGSQHLVAELVALLHDLDHGALLRV